MRYRKLTRPLTFTGKGLHSGEPCVLCLEPDEAGLSLEARGEKHPIAELSFSGTGRGSDLIFPSGQRVRTCEHVLSALAGLGVWCARLRVEGPEMPALDGCAATLAAQIAENSVPAVGPKPFSLSCPLHVGDGERFVVALPAPAFRVTYTIAYRAEAVGTQIFDFDATTDYLEEVAPARTFVMAEDLRALREQGMALGGSLDNAILIENEGVWTTGGLRFPTECVRHKVLDLLGDLAVLGRPLNAHVVAVRAGHVQHLQLAERLRAAARGA